MSEYGTDKIYRDGKHYDSLNNFDNDVPFYIELASTFGSHILDLGCGTGRISIPLALNGFNVVGLDESDSMLAEAINKASIKNVNIDFIKGDFINFNLNREFEIILMSFNSICHLYSFESLVSCFTCIKQHLKPNGLFVIDVVNPDLNFLTRGKEKRTSRASYTNPYGNGIVKLTQSNHYDKVQQINFNKWYFNIADKEIEQELNKRIFFPQEIDNYLKLLGFKIENKFGDFDKSEFTSDSPKQIIISKNA